jgi:mannose-6-phosphate isomerase-like protein (cupin superfamily)
MKRVEKPWGEELWVAHNESYALKIIRIAKGTRTSLQYHERKRESIYIDRGAVKAELEDASGRMVVSVLGAGEVIENEPLRKHRLEALEETRLIEVSTPHLDDVVRVEDDYRRSDATGRAGCDK